MTIPIYVIHDLIALAKRIAITLSVWGVGLGLYLLACKSMGLL